MNEEQKHIAVTPVEVSTSDNENDEKWETAREVLDLKNAEQLLASKDSEIETLKS